MKVFEGRVPRPPVVGRIRLGVFEKGYPQSSDVLIFTAKLPETLEPLAKQYGGEVKPYVPQKSKEKEYRLISKTDSIEVWFPFPTADENVIQAYELWKHTGIQRRCDGYTVSVNELDTETGEIVTEERPCICEAKGDLECDTTTILRLFLPQTPGLGVWELKTTSRWALFELHDVIRFLASRFDGSMHRLPLRLSYSPKTMNYFDEKSRKMKRVVKRIPTLNLAGAYMEVVQGLARAEIPGMQEEARALAAGGSLPTEPEDAAGAGGNLSGVGSNPAPAAMTRPAAMTLREIVRQIAPEGKESEAEALGMKYIRDVLELKSYDEVNPENWDTIQMYVTEEMWPEEQGSIIPEDE